MTKREANISLPVVADKRTIRRSRNGRRRAIVLATIQLLMVAHVVQWAVTGSTLSPIEPSESMETVKRGVINAGTIFFAIALLSTLVLGRWFCGWGCHLVMMQDGCGWLLRRVGIHPKPFRSRLLVYVPFILALYMFVWPAVARWGIIPLSKKLHGVWETIPEFAPDQEWTGFSVQVTTSDFWHTFPGVMVAIPFLLICGFATVYFLGNKGFCTYGCPYGGFFAPLEHYAPGRIRVTDACEHCGHCTAVCTSNVRVHEEVREYGMVVDQGCMKCLDCVSVCPNDALYFGFGRPAATKGAPRNRAPKPILDLSVWEEIAFGVVFLASFLAVRGVYDLVPMLMAAGIAGCLTFLAWKLWQMARGSSVNFHRFRLKYKGSITRSGAVFASLATLALALAAHSGAVKSLEFLAGRADGKVTITRAAIFSPAPMAMDPAMAEHADRALRLYGAAASLGEGGIGLFRHSSAEIRRAWLHACRHEFFTAERILRRRNEQFGRADLVCRDIALLMRIQLDDDRAQAYYEEILATDPTLVRTIDDYVLWHHSEGRLLEAIEVCRTALAGNPDPDGARLYLLRRLSLLLVESGQLDEGIRVFEETIAIDDQTPATFVLLAEAHRLNGNEQAALESIRRAVDLAPSAPLVLDDAAALLEMLGRADEANEVRAQAAAARAARAASSR